MARKKSPKVAANAETVVLDYRHDEAKRKNIPLDFMFQLTYQKLNNLKS